MTKRDDNVNSEYSIMKSAIEAANKIYTILISSCKSPTQNMQALAQIVDNNDHAASLDFLLNAEEALIQNKQMIERARR